MTGNEEPLDEYGMRIWVDWIRNAVLLTSAQMRKSAYEQLDEVRPLLSEWMQGLTRDEIILALGAIPAREPSSQLGQRSRLQARGSMASSMTLRQRSRKTTGTTRISDRLLYGNAVANYIAGNHATSLADIDATADKASAALLMLLKRRARRASPASRHTKTMRSREGVVRLFCGSNAFRDLCQ